MSLTFDLTAKAALVTGCSTRLGQGMSLGHTKAGVDTVDAGWLAR